MHKTFIGFQKSSPFYTFYFFLPVSTSKSGDICDLLPKTEAPKAQVGDKSGRPKPKKPKIRQCEFVSEERFSYFPDKTLNLPN